MEKQVAKHLKDQSVYVFLLFSNVRNVTLKLGYPHLSELGMKVDYVDLNKRLFSKVA